MVAISKMINGYGYPLSISGSDYYNCVLWFYWVVRVEIQGGSYVDTCYFSLSGNTLNYYTNESRTAGGSQLNTSGETYYYIAIG